MNTQNEINRLMNHNFHLHTELNNIVVFDINKHFYLIEIAKTGEILRWIVDSHYNYIGYSFNQQNKIREINEP